MEKEALKKIFWGLAFIMINFRVKGIDIMPDIIGYALFTSVYESLKRDCDICKEAEKHNWWLLIMSIFTIYQKSLPVCIMTLEANEFEPYGIISVIFSIVYAIFSIIAINYIFKVVYAMVLKSERVIYKAQTKKRWVSCLGIQLYATAVAIGGYHMYTGIGIGILIILIFFYLLDIFNFFKKLQETF